MSGHSGSARRWWHYTVGTALVGIVADGRISAARALVHQGERKAVWFSCRETWEPTATPGILLSEQVPTNQTREDIVRACRDMTFDEMIDRFGALVRIEVPEDIPKHTWDEHRRKGGIGEEIANALEASGRRRGADPADWWLTYEDVPMGRCLQIEESHDGAVWNLVGRPDGEGRTL